MVHRDGQADRGADGKAKPGDTLRHRALEAIENTRWVPPPGENRITGMIESRPDWVISRQRAWGVPITVFVREKDDGSVEILNDERVNKRIADAFEKEGADAWYATAPPRGSSSPTTTRTTGRRSTTFSMSGSIPARRTPSCWKTPSIFPRSPGSSASRRRRRHGDVSRRLRPASRLVPFLAARNPAARADARPTTSCSPMASCSTRTDARCRSRSAT